LTSLHQGLLFIYTHAW